MSTKKYYNTELLDKAFENYDMTQSEFCEIFKISPIFIHSLYTQDLNCFVSDLYKICFILNINVKDFLLI